MIVALWQRWRERRRWWWLVVIGAVLALDALVGSALIAWELRVLRGML